MIFYPAVTIHSAADARVAAGPGEPVTLLSAPGAGLYAGALWWRAIVAAADATGPVLDILDCDTASGLALAALRAGSRSLILRPEAPGWQSVAERAALLGGCVLAAAPPSLDLAAPGAARHLRAWLGAQGCTIRR